MSDKKVVTIADVVQMIDSYEHTVGKLPIQTLDFARYQRADRDTWQKRMVRHFNPALLGTILVSQRDGGYWVFDGRQRVGLCKLAGYNAPLDAVVYTGLTYQQEAGLFRAFNEQRTQMGRPEVFNAKLQEDNAAAWQLATLAQEVGCEVATKSTGWVSVDMINAVGALENVQKILDGDERQLRQFFRVVTASWPGDRDRWNGYLIEGVAAFLAKYGDLVDATSLIDKLKKVLPTTLLAMGTANARNQRLTTRKATGLAILGYYNQGKRRNRLPEWDAVPAVRGDQ